jgi:hypothetical protein
MKKDTYLSIIVTTRNDDHGGNLLYRTQIFVNGVISQCERHKLKSELIIVEWNPLPDRPRLREVLKWPTSSDYCRVRIIEVPAEIHSRFKHSDQLPLFQMIAKNVGIRRSHGKFILATNVDLLFPDRMMKYLAACNLKDNLLYRCDRYDVPADIPMDVPVNEQMEFCRRNVIRVNLRQGTFSTSSKFNRTFSSFIRITLSLLLFLYHLFIMLLWIPYRLIVGYPGSTKNRRYILSDGLHQIKMYWYPVGSNLQVFLLPLNRLFHKTTAFSACLHTNACGDFTIMAKEQWLELRGYPELQMYSLHIDSLICYMAHYSGLKECVLKYPVYHIEHLSGWSPDESQSLLKRMEAKGIPVMSYTELLEWENRIRVSGASVIMNGEDWGLGNINLAEITISGSGELL